MVIHKQVLIDAPRQRITLPKTSRILSIDNQHTDFVIWYLYDDEQHFIENANITIEIAAIRTGCIDYGLPKDAIFINTASLGHGDYILHFFNLGEV